MERLTVPAEKLPGGGKRIAIIDARKVQEHAMDIYWQLKAYEDTGLTPDQIVAMKAELEDMQYRHDRLQDFCVAQSDQLDEAKANALPVRVGQQVWYYHKNRWGNQIFTGDIVEIFIPDDTGRIGVRAKRLGTNARFTGQLGVDVFTEKPQTEEGERRL